MVSDKEYNHQNLARTLCWVKDHDTSNREAIHGGRKGPVISLFIYDVEVSNILDKKKRIWTGGLRRTGNLATVHIHIARLLALLMFPLDIRRGRNPSSH